ncbi:phosphatase PAP2 family protein [Parafrankia sp. EUN1f]|uniref:phosphatase PAP2 family protein n=2 Tax=Parafrankia sp. EUN1f TaxID=102897 RepID=UPI001E658EF1|nr:phosphatase PAP2 family protein [Parafrankia sp. EUN1f]
MAVVLVIVLVVAGQLIVDGAGGVRAADEAAARWLAAHREPSLLDVTRWATYLADLWVVVGAGAVLAAVTAWWSRGWWLPAGVIALTAGEAAIYEVSNTLVARPRPAVARLDPGDPMASFPSGHSAASVCLYGGLAYVLHGIARHRAAGAASERPAASQPVVPEALVSESAVSHPAAARRVVAVARWLWLPAAVAALVLPLVVAFCRTYRGMHYPSDVIAGLFLGTCWFFAVSAAVLSRAWRASAPETGMSF